MANNGDQDSQREHRPKRARTSPILFRSSINSEQNSPENQTADKQQLDQPGDDYGFLQSSVNQGGIPQLTQLHLSQRGASNFIDQGREQPQALIQQQPDTSRGKKRRQQQSAPDSPSPEIRQTIPEHRLRKRQADKRYRERIKCGLHVRHKREQTKADLEKLEAENGQLKDECWKLKSEVEKHEAENGQLKDERWKLKSEVEKLKAENGQLACGCQRMRSQEVELEAENRYSSRKNNDSCRSFTHGCGPPQSSTSGFQNVGPSVQQSNFNTLDDWSHNRDNGVDELGQPMPQLSGMGDHAPINMPENGFQNEDMQLMPGLFSMGGLASMNMPEEPYIPSPMSRSLEMLETEDMEFMWQFSVEGINMHEDGYTFPPYIPSPRPNFDEERSHTSKIIRGLLKIRAVIKWGSVTRKAAERRAQIVELEEEEQKSAFSLHDLLGCQ